MHNWKLQVANSTKESSESPNFVIRFQKLYKTQVNFMKN